MILISTEVTLAGFQLSRQTFLKRFKIHYPTATYIRSFLIRFFSNSCTMFSASPNNFLPLSRLKNFRVDLATELLKGQLNQTNGYF